MAEEDNLARLVDEYRSLICQSECQKGGPDWEALTARLIVDGEWTVAGAHRLASLVQTYGSFVLRNAAALAIAANIEDGSEGM
jgi:hypothetical protein